MVLDHLCTIYSMVYHYTLYTVKLYNVFSLIYCIRYHILYTIPCNTVLSYTVYNIIYCIKHKYSRFIPRWISRRKWGDCCHNVDLRDGLSERWL